MTSFDFSPGAQVPLTHASPTNAPTQMLAATAYRDEPISKLTGIGDTAGGHSKGKVALLEPNLGEAFTEAVIARMLAPGRGNVVQSFGVDPVAVVQHCLMAARVRRERDAKLTGIMGLFGVLFLPGTLAWLGAFQLRRMLSKSPSSQNTALGGLVLFVVAVFAVLFFLRPPFSGLWQLYARIMLIAPVAGWYLAQRVCRTSTEELRRRWITAADGGAVPSVPDSVPRGPNDTKAEKIRVQLEKLVAEQSSNVLFYAGTKGILGMGPRWGSWAMAGELTPRDGEEIHPFRCWDVVRAIHGKLRALDRGPLNSGGFPSPSVKDWVVVHVGEGADSISRPSGAEVDGYSIKDFEVQRICNENQFDKGNRHYLGVQFVLWDGQLVLNLLTTVTVLHSTLRVEVTAHTLGPVAGAFGGKPSAKTKSVRKAIKFYESKKVALPVVGTDEVIRLAARAPLTWHPDLLHWLGGKLSLPEPFGLRHAWAGKPWSHRFMADDILRAAAPVLRAVHKGTLQVLEANNVDTSTFMALDGAAVSPSPGRPDTYDTD